MSERLKMAMGKCINIVYYYNNDPRPYKQYIHILREFKTTLVDLLSDLWEMRGSDKIYVQAYDIFKPILEALIKVLGDDSLSCKTAIDKMQEVIDTKITPVKGNIELIVEEICKNELPF